mmetsp:Transcript_28842/g.47775  ORF Transcript_28842/g.47775 Transcript_28842/m.47775 type:complete len:293 (-) Transcript_28842:179-1057(-)
MLLLLLSALCIYEEEVDGDPWDGPCPTSCTCIQNARNGCKLAAFCEGREASSFLRGFSAETDCLSVSNPNLAKLSTDSKHKFLMALPAELRFLSLQMCGLGAGSGLPNGAFSRFRHLVSLDLEFNMITSLPHDAFHGATALRTLWLTGNHWQPDERGYKQAQAMGNRLSSLAPDQFVGLRSLQVLLMHHNNLKSLPSALFSEQTELRVLKLVDNSKQFQLSEPALAQLLTKRRRCQPGSPSGGDCLQLDLTEDSGDLLEDIWDEAGVAVMAEPAFSEKMAKFQRSRNDHDEP